MEQITVFFTELLSTEGFPPRWFCGQWSSFHGWLYIGSNLAIWAAYYTIPALLVYFTSRRKDLPFLGVFWLFAAFILACGTTHLLDALIFWWPAYRLSGIMLLLTAIISVVTVVALVPMIPKALALRSPQELEQEIEERKEVEGQLVQATESAIRASRYKSDFLANMSHEIRTPINGILGMTDIVRDSDNLTDDQRHYLDMAYSSGQSLLVIINDILDFSKIEAGKLALDHTPFPLRQSIAEVLYPLGQKAHEKGVEVICHVHPDVPDYVVGDMTRIRQIVMNLVGNAVKFTPRGEVILSLTAEEQVDAMVPLKWEIRDTGIGMSDEQMQQVFDPFMQADNSTARKYGGTGLGLSITQQLIEMMGGTLQVESVKGGGSRFYFTLRLGQSSETDPVRSIVAFEKLQGHRVLVVDDNRASVQVLENTLSHWGMEVTAVNDAERALGLLRQSDQETPPFDALLCDDGIPLVDGTALVQALKQEAQEALPVIMLNANPQPGDIGRYETLGVAHVDKPVESMELAMILCKVLGYTELLSTHTALPSEEKSSIQKPSGRILLVEDNMVNRLMAQKILEEGGYTVMQAENGIEALTIFKQETFDLILMDVQMPEMDGYEATTAIRDGEANSEGRIPIIALTANAIKGDREQCLAAGMDDYLSKPFNKAELLAIVQKWQRVAQNS